MRNITPSTIVLSFALFCAGCAFHNYKSSDGARITSASLFMKRASVDLQRTTNGATNGTARARINGSQVDSEALSKAITAAVEAAVKSTVP